MHSLHYYERPSLVYSKSVMAGNCCAYICSHYPTVPQVHTICSSCSSHCTATLKPVECQLACVHHFQIIDVQMEPSDIKCVSFMEAYKKANFSAIIHVASTSIATTSFMVRTIVHYIKTPSILLCNNNFHVQCSRF